LPTLTFFLRVAQQHAAGEQQKQFRSNKGKAKAKKQMTR